MELWIRSQAKNKLLKVACMEVKQFEEGYGIVELIGSGDTGYGLGIYKTRERALEVLDEIQKLLQPQMVLSKVGKPIAETCDGTVYVNPDEYEIKELSTYVYEMPKD